MAHKSHHRPHWPHGLDAETLRRWRYWIVAAAALVALILASSTANA